MTKTQEKVYEVGLHIVPDVGDKEVLSVFNSLKTEISSVGEVIDENTPELIELAYTIRHKTRKEDGTYNRYDSAYFGSIKFVSSQEGAVKIKEAIQNNESVLRFLLVETVRESTRMSLPEEEKKVEDAVGIKNK